jgi:hypothetical protein
MEAGVRHLLITLALLSGVALPASDGLFCPGAEEEIAATVQGSVEKDVSKLLMRVVNVTLEVRVDDVRFSRSGLVPGETIRVIETYHCPGNGPVCPPRYGKGTRLRMGLKRFEHSRYFQPAASRGCIELLSE